MTLEEIKRAINEFRSSGHTDEDILETFRRMYLDNQIDLREFKGLVDVLGYELNEAYDNISKVELRQMEITKLVSIEYDPETKETEDYVSIVYNPNVYTPLLERARKTKSGTKEFIEYIAELDCNLRLESMKYLKLSLMPGTKYTSKAINDLLDSSRYKGYNTFYHLYLAYWECNKKLHSKACQMIEKDLEEMFNINYHTAVPSDPATWEYTLECCSAEPNYVYYDIECNPNTDNHGKYIGSDFTLEVFNNDQWTAVPIHHDDIPLVPFKHKLNNDGSCTTVTLYITDKYYALSAGKYRITLTIYDSYSEDTENPAHRNFSSEFYIN